ncbi:hypothetical protein Taro_030793 [Colocasia esculenta]|uniref:Uncharacterized protein n=1 Tax=Colocasia esculenta TaxID=4460 RepID=A0A843VX53_COLES|nr:hypothetical protein [Colocasia esculenta]
MVATPRGVVTWLLLCRADRSRLGALPCDSSTVLGARGARAEVVLSRSCRGRARDAWSREEVLVWDAEVVLRSSSRRSPASPFLVVSLFAAPEPPREARHGTVVWPNYGDETSQQWQGARRAEETGR